MLLKFLLLLSRRPENRGLKMLEDTLISNFTHFGEFIRIRLNLKVNYFEGLCQRQNVPIEA